MICLCVSVLMCPAAAVQCRCVLVPAVSGPLQAAAAWRLMVGLAGRQLSMHSQRALGAAAAALVQVGDSQAGWLAG
jgi:hypothetical protein